MRRRELFKAAAVGALSVAAPRIGRAERASKLVFVPPIDLTVLDPVVTALRSTRNHAYLVFDTLYGIVAVRRALLGAVDQAEAMTAVAGANPAFWRDGIGLFGGGTPFANDARIDVLTFPGKSGHRVTRILPLPVRG